MTARSNPTTTHTWPARLLGLSTAGYGAAVLVRPSLLARPCGLPMTPEGRLPTATAVLSRAVAARDLVSGVAMTTARDPQTMATTIGVRVGCDVADTVVFGLALPERKARAKAAVVAGAWGLLCAGSALPLRGKRTRSGSSSE